MKIFPSTPVSTLAAGAILSALALNFAGVSSAGEAATPPQVIVKFADLDPSTSAGAEALYHRIYGAADTVCARMYVSAEAYKWYRNACLRKVIADTVAKVHQPALSAVLASRYGVSTPVVLAAAEGR